MDDLGSGTHSEAQCAHLGNHGTHLLVSRGLKEPVQVWGKGEPPGSVVSCSPHPHRRREWAGVGEYRSGWGGGHVRLYCLVLHMLLLAVGFQ